MDDQDRLAERFETHRGHLRAVAYRMLGSRSEADDAAQEAWLRLSRSDTSDVVNLAGWLTTVVSRVCLDMLRSRRSRREQPLAPHGPEPSAPREEETGPEQHAVLADSVGLALLVVLDRLAPAERVAFVLHDMFAVPFDQIAPIVDRSSIATKKLASRARLRVQGGSATVPAADLTRRRHVVDAFLAASRAGDLNGLLAVLAPDVVRRADPVVLPAGVATEIHGARAVAEETRTNVKRARVAEPALVGGAPGLVVVPGGRLLAAIRLTIEGDKITEVDIVADPARLDQLDLAVLAD